MQRPMTVPDSSTGGTEGKARRYAVWVCSDCGEQVDPPGHGDYAEPNVAGHYHADDSFHDGVKLEVSALLSQDTGADSGEQRRWTLYGNGRDREVTVSGPTLAEGAEVEVGPVSDPECETAGGQRCPTEHDCWRRQTCIEWDACDGERCENAPGRSAPTDEGRHYHGPYPAFGSAPARSASSSADEALAQLFRDRGWQVYGPNGERLREDYVARAVLSVPTPTGEREPCECCESTDTCYYPAEDGEQVSLCPSCAVQLARSSGVDAKAEKYREALERLARWNEPNHHHAGVREFARSALAGGESE